MAFFANRGINRLALHIGLYQFAWCTSGVFFGVFLLRAGLSPAAIFLTGGATLLLRFLIRPVILVVVPRLGLRRTLVVGTLFSALQYPAIGFVHGAGVALGAFAAIGALAGIFYWPCYHAFFAAIGDARFRGSQIGIRQLAMGLAAVLGPAFGGLMLMRFGPWVAFGTAAAIEVVAILPLLGVRAPPVPRLSPRGAYAAARTGTLLFATDGWIICCAVIAWDIIVFRALQSRYDAFGGTLALAALGGGLGGVLLGRFIDQGHARRAIRLNALILALALLARSLCGASPAMIVAVAVLTTMLGGIYAPTLMTAFYNDAKSSPCPFRFQFAAEGGWDLGGVAASLAAAAVCAAGRPLQMVILMALPAVLIQARLLAQAYRAHQPVPPEVLWQAALDPTLSLPKTLLSLDLTERPRSVR
jgi:MFS transporter, DHA1 family, inner membrane transport protein